MPILFREAGTIFQTVARGCNDPKNRKLFLNNQDSYRSEMTLPPHLWAPSITILAIKGYSLLFALDPTVKPSAILKTGLPLWSFLLEPLKFIWQSTEARHKVCNIVWPNIVSDWWRWKHCKHRYETGWVSGMNRHAEKRVNYPQICLFLNELLNIIRQPTWMLKP